MIFERVKGKMNVASLNEHIIGSIVLFRNKDRSSTHRMNQQMGVMEPLPQPARIYIAIDRRTEFRNWRKRKQELGTDA